jgi:hypothetical protein
LALEFATNEILKTAYKVPVDVVWVILVLDKRTVSKNLPDANLPQLARENLKIRDQPVSPRAVPRGISLLVARTQNQNRVPEFVEGQFIILWREEAVGVEGWDFSHGSSHT